jgi:hypothetical protein
MEKSPRRKSGAYLGMCTMMLVFFSRTPGADTVRWVQIVLLLVAGACAGAALVTLRDHRAP